MDGKEDEENPGNQPLDSFGVPRHPASALSGEDDDTASLQPQNAPHRTSNPPRFGRPNPDSLRRRAMSGAMRNTAAEPTSEASSGYSPDRAPQDRAPSSVESIQASPALRQVTNIMTQETSPPRQISSRYLDAARRDAEWETFYLRAPHHQERAHEQAARAETQTRSYDTGLDQHSSYSLSPDRRVATPSIPGYNIVDSSTPGPVGNPANWLLPHPFSPSQAELFSASETGRGSGASTPSSLRTGARDTPTVHSPFFRQENRMPGSSDPFTTVAYPSDPFVAVRSGLPSSRYGGIAGNLENPYQRHNASYLETRRSALHNPDEGSMSSSPPAKVQARLDFPLACDLPAIESECAYGPSVISGAVTQTFTPSTSPFRREMARGRGAGLGGTIGSYRATRPGQYGGQPTGFQGPIHRESRLASPFQPMQQDSSILSPLGNVAPPRDKLRPTAYLAERAMEAASRDQAQAERLLVHKPDLDPDSDSESGNLGTRSIVRSTQRAEAANSLATPEPLEEQDQVVCALSESRSADVVGVSVLNVTLGHVDLFRVVNDDKYRRLIETLSRTPTWPQTFLLLTKTVEENSKSALVICLRKEFPNARLVPMDRDHWNESDGLKMVDRFAWRKDIKAIRASLDNNFYVSCALSAVMAYVEEETEVIFRENSLRIRYKQAADTMGLDRSTITSLELFQNIRNAKGTSLTLFGLLNNTLTPQGRRLIRSALLQPSTNKHEISARHETVEELSSNEDLFTEVRASLKRILHIDIERSIPWVTLKTGEPRLPLQSGVAEIHGRHQIAMPSHEELQGAEKDMNHVLMIKAYLGGVQAVRETLQAAECRSQLCKWVLEQCSSENTAPILRLIEESIEPDAIFSKTPIDIRNNRLWALKAEPNGVLEGARQLYRDRTNELHEYVEGLNKTFQEQLGTAPELRLVNDNHYQLRFQWSDVERELARDGAVPEEGSSSGTHSRRPRLLAGVRIVNGIRRKQHYDCQTLELIQRSSQIQRHADIVTTQSNTFVVDLKKALLEHAGPLLAVNEAIAVLDMVCSFAHLATTQNYVRPLLSGTLVLKGARHPVMEARKQNFVANDVYLGDQGARFQVVTGGNMSGKSTFIRSVALIQIMAQIGSFVPATYAAVPICDRLFTRLSTEDKPESNLGSFSVEMTEMNMIIRQVTKNSLVIIDELGRGTSTDEGLAIALAMSEDLIKRGCRAFFATHFTELARVLNATKQNRVLNVHVSGESTKHGNTAQISLPHTIAPGPVKNEDYGLDLARRFLPERVVDNSEQVCTFLRDKNAGKAAGPATRARKQNTLILALPDLLKQAHTSTMDDPALDSYVKKLQTEFTIRMNIAADDDGQEEQTDATAAPVTELPALGKPSKEELEGWKKKCDTAERRVMHANMSRSQEKKRPASAQEEDDTESLQQKRNKTSDGTATTPTVHLTPINRGSMIEELRRAAGTPTTRPASTISSAGESYADTPYGHVTTQGVRLAAGLAPVNSQRAAFVSSGTPARDIDTDTEMPDADSAGPALPAIIEQVSAEPQTPSQPAQPLERFQALRA